MSARTHTHTSTHKPAQLPLETQGKNKTYNSICNFLLLIPSFHALRRTALSAASPGWSGSGPLCQHSLILARRQDRCHGVWAASQHYGNFKAPFATISTFPHSCPPPPRQDLRQASDKGRENENETEDSGVKPLSRSVKDSWKVILNREGKLHKGSKKNKKNVIRIFSPN